MPKAQPNPIALRKVKIAYSFGLSEYNRVKGGEPAHCQLLLMFRNENSYCFVNI